MTNIESEIQAYLDEHYVQKPKMNFRKYVLTRMQELLDNNIHVSEYRFENGTVIAAVQSYAVFDYIDNITNI